MGVAKFDDGIPDGPKFLAAGPIACWLWFCGVCYSRRTYTDGFIPYQKVATLTTASAPYKHAERLVEVGLWERADDGFVIHDFHDWNPSKATVEQYRKRDRERKQRRFLDRIPDGHSDRIPDGIQTESDRRGASRAGAKSESEKKSESESSSETGEESAREGAEPVDSTDGIPPAWNTSRPTRRQGLAGSHVGCFHATPDACARGLCVPGWLGQEWRQQFGDDTATADDTIRQVVSSALAALPPGPIGDDPKVFWRAVWRESFGSAAPTGGHPARTKGHLTLEAARRFVQTRMEVVRAN